MPKPTLTVCMPNYNHGKYITQSIESVVTQSRIPDEFIILDDASTDESPEIIESYVKKFPSIRFIRNQRNAGAVSSIHRLIGLATGDFIYIASADDRILPGFFEKAMDMAARYPNAGIIVGECVVVDTKGKKVGIQTHAAWRQSRYVNPESFLREYLYQVHPTHSFVSAVMYQREKLIDVGGFREELGFWSDTFAFRVIGLRSGICFIKQRCAHWRVVPDSLCHATLKDEQKQLEVLQRLVRLMKSPEFGGLFPLNYVGKWAGEYQKEISERVGRQRDAQLTKPNPLRRFLHRQQRSLRKRLDKVRLYLRPPEISLKNQRDFPADPENFSDWPAPDVRLIAFYLPQFHPIPENDAWWGKGFTEWTNVRRGQPLFPGHYQPHIPHADVGYYDLNDDAVMERQVAMARRFGIHGFCFHHYWFNGKRLLEMPVERMLRTGRPDFPFCLCWANENWTRRWDGADREILIAQDHSAEDDERFIQDVIRVMRHPRYIRVEGRPLLVVYQPAALPDAAATVRRWRNACRMAGIGEVYLACVQRDEFMRPDVLGMDALVGFPPHHTFDKIIKPSVYAAPPDFLGCLADYMQTVRHAIAIRHRTKVPLHYGVMPSWDNTARLKQNATVFVNSNPSGYYYWLRDAVIKTRQRYRGDKQLVFINAWNEWAEGCHLEPDVRHGYAWLNATRQALLPPESRFSLHDSK